MESVFSGESAARSRSNPISAEREMSRRRTRSQTTTTDALQSQEGLVVRRLGFGGSVIGISATLYGCDPDSGRGGMQFSEFLDPDLIPNSRRSATLRKDAVKEIMSPPPPYPSILPETRHFRALHY